MSMIIQLPEDVERNVREAAAAEGRKPEEVVADLVASRFAIAANRAPQDEDMDDLPLSAEEIAEVEQLLNSPASSFDPEARRRRFGLPNLSHLTDTELAQMAEQEIAKMTPEQRALAKQHGVL